MEKSTVSAERVLHVLQQRFGQISRFHQLAEGLSSQAFGFCLKDDEYVIRINRRIEGYQKDAFVSKKFGRLTLPIPEVIDIQPLDDRHVYCISRRAPGVRLQDLGDRYMQGIAHKVVQLMKHIAASNLEGTTGYGSFNSYGEGAYKNWNDYLLSIADPSKYNWERMEQSLNMEVVRKGIESVQSLAEFCPEQRKLIHGDFGSFNMMSDGHRITALIDWDLSMFGDPLYECANLNFWNEDKMKPVISKLAIQFDEPRYEERVQCYQLRIALEEIYRSAIGQNPVDTSWLMARLEASL